MISALPVFAGSQIAVSASGESSGHQFQLVRSPPSFVKVSEIAQTVDVKQERLEEQPTLAVRVVQAVLDEVEHGHGAGAAGAGDQHAMLRSEHPRLADGGSELVRRVVGVAVAAEDLLLLQQDEGPVQRAALALAQVATFQLLRQQPLLLDLLLADAAGVHLDDRGEFAL